ncbi:hypothetical protein NCAS_0H03280 [Naumovozyma castellii]|uniref:Uncharacterized protein n=1 Tax=Naumovozyma castellii TaxID=27288 RepID=G0VJF9_NAUCA|nr:hypothetical protein NCAS_0H03280 [Naumovozyma castellii CBS 4309]CCC71638.1 hypothetical protein NCAS_0H03280 [Naumovozyma castellii CBS 4309]
MSSSTANSNNFATFCKEKAHQKSQNMQQNQRAYYYNMCGQTSEETDDEDDMIVDLSSGSLTAVPLKSWTLMTEITEQFGKL